jgi:hypothetical protein
MDPENPGKANGESPLFRLVMTTLVAALFIFGVVIPNFVETGPHSGGSTPKGTCIWNLRQIDNAKENWALQTKAPASAIPTWENIRPYLGRGSAGEILKCPSGGVYTIGALSNAPTCSIKGHALQ